MEWNYLFPRSGIEFKSQKIFWWLLALTLLKNKISQVWKYESTAAWKIPRWAKYENMNPQHYEGFQDYPSMRIRIYSSVKDSNMCKYLNVNPQQHYKILRWSKYEKENPLQRESSQDDPSTKICINSSMKDFARRSKYETWLYTSLFLW
jgi:hypothetical protein